MALAFVLLNSIELSSQEIAVIAGVLQEIPLRSHDWGIRGIHKVAS
jgi:hypothetical protein